MKIYEENGLTKEHNSRMMCELEYVLDNNVEGDIADIGCWQGTMSFIMAEILLKRNTDKTIYLFDTFEGHNTSQIDKVDESWAFINNLNYFKLDNIVKNIEKTFGAIRFKNYRIVKGDIFETFELKYPKFCFASLDLNFYNPTVRALSFMENHLSENGLIIEDDYNNIEGITKAFNENNRFKIFNTFNPGASFR